MEIELEATKATLDKLLNSNPALKSQADDILEAERNNAISNMLGEEKNANDAKKRGSFRGRRREKEQPDNSEYVSALNNQLKTVKGAYEVLSGYHDKMVKSINFYENDMRDKTDEISGLKYENKLLVEQLEKMKQAAQNQDMSQVDELTNVNDLKHSMEVDEEFLKFQKEEQSKSRFGRYINNDLKVFKEDISKLNKQSLQIGGKTDATQKMVIDDLKKKGLIKFEEGSARNVIPDGSALNFSDAPSLNEMYDMDAKGKSKSKGKVGAKGGKSSKLINADDDNDSDNVQVNRGSGNRAGKKTTSKGKKIVTNTSGQVQNDAYDETDSEEDDYVDDRGKPLPEAEIRKRKEKKAKEKQERTGMTATSNSLGTGFNKPETVKFAKNKKDNLKNKTVIDETAVEGGKLLGTRSEAYSITRGGVKIRVNDMGTGTEISAGDMDQGVTVLNTAQLQGKAIDNDSQILQPPPNVEAKIEIDPTTGKKLATFTLKTGIVIKIDPQNPTYEAELTKGGLRHLLKLLTTELGIEDVLQMAENRQMNQLNNKSMVQDQTMASTRRSGKKGNESQSSILSPRGDREHNSSLFASEIVDEIGGDDEPMYSEKSVDSNEVLAPVVNQRVEKQKDGTKVIVKVLEDGRIVREVVDKKGKVISKKISEEPVNADSVERKRQEVYEDMTVSQQRTLNKIMMLLKNIPDSEMKKVTEFIEKFLKGMQTVSSQVAKQLEKLAPEAKQNMTDLAKELEGSGGKGIKLDVSKVSKKDLEVLNEKPPPVRKMGDLKKDKEGNLVDDAGNVVISKDQNANMVKDKEGNLIDKTTGKVMFNKDGEFVQDKVAASKHIAKKEAVKKKIMQDQMKEHIKQGGKIDGMVVDNDGNLKVVASDGKLIDFAGDSKELDVNTLVADAEGNLLNPETGEVVVDKTGNYVGSKLTDMGNVVKAAQSGDVDSLMENMTNLGGKEFMKKNQNSFTPSNKGKFFNKGNINMRSEQIINTKKGFQFTDESKDQRQVDAEIRSVFTKQLGDMPNIYGEEQYDKDGNKVINQAYNPLAPGNSDNPEFYRNLYKAFKMTRLAQGENLRYESLGPDGQYHPNFESEEFDTFRNQVKKFAGQHGKCGEFCKHLLRFYSKLGFFPARKYENKKILKLPKLNMDNDFTRVRSSEVLNDTDMSSLMR